MSNKSTAEKMEYLCKHSEKLALCFALISLPVGTPVSPTSLFRQRMKDQEREREEQECICKLDYTR
jgi:hypothetical protein